MTSGQGMSPKATHNVMQCMHGGEMQRVDNGIMAREEEQPYETTNRVIAKTSKRSTKPYSQSISMIQSSKVR